MAPPSPAELFLIVGIVVFFVAVFAFSRSSASRPHSLMLVLLLLAVTSGLTGVIGASATVLDAEKIDYTVRQTEPQQCNSENPSSPKEYSELSSEAQNVFRSTLQTDGAYTTKTHPDDFRLMTDQGTVNHIQYESTCYELSAQSRGSFGTGFVVIFYLIAGGVGFLLASGLSLALGRANEAISMLSGLGSAVILAESGMIQFSHLAGATVLIGILTWIVVRGIEKSSHKSFSELIET